MLAWAPGTGATGTGVHPFNIEINSVDRISMVDIDSVGVEMPGPGSNGSLTFTIRDATATVIVNVWDEVRFLEHAATRPILFGGFVQSRRYVPWARTGRDIIVTCAGYGILLDKKVVPTFAFAHTFTFIPEPLVSLINRFGGRITGAINPTKTAGIWAYTNAQYSIAHVDVSWAANWSLGFITIPDNQYLRGAIEATIGKGAYLFNPVPEPASASYWVDSAAQLRVFPDIPDHAFADDNGAWRGQFDQGTVPGITVDQSGALRISGTDAEVEDTDRLTSAYIVSSTPAGTGFFRTPALERAGDLETILTDNDSLTVADVAGKGGAVVNQTTSATQRASVDIQANGPLDIWPGRNLRFTDPQTDVPVAQNWRITSTRIAFDSATTRTYTVGFGGNIPQPSMARRSGRFKTRGFGA
jgi:hypothetical protein